VSNVSTSSVSSPKDAAARLRIERELTEAKRRVDELEAELAQLASPSGTFPGYYGSYYATTGFLLGMIGAVVSLLFNVVGSLLVSQPDGGTQHPLRLVQVYLTFPFGERALHMDGPLALALGCCLYVATGSLLGMVFHLVLTRFTAGSTFGKRMLVGTFFALAVWVVNFYGVLSWLQPLLFGGRWIVDMIPPWVAAATHLVFGWTMVVLYPWGLYVPYRVETESK
jgi:hypothetical protein